MKSPLKVTISPSHPLLIIMVNPGPSYDEAGRMMVKLWEDLDDDVRPLVTVQIEGTRSDNYHRDEVHLRYAQGVGLPVTLQIQGDNGDRHDTMPIDRVRRFVDTYPCIVGLQIVEASQRTFADHAAGPEYSMGRNARYARDVIRLAGEYGLFMSWQLMRENYAVIGCSGDNEALYDAVCEYGDYVIPMHEMNCEFAKLIDHMGAMGLWLAGATAQWGVEAQSWYWHDSGYRAPGICYPGTLDMPGELYAIMFLLGASAGATAYSIEPPQDAWSEQAGWRYREWMRPLLTRLVKERLIPTRDEVLAAMPVAYHLPRCRRPADWHRVSADLDFDHGEGRLIRAMDGVYDRARDAEMIPNNPRYGWIPALPAKTSESILSRFGRILRPGDAESVEQARRILGEHFPPVDRGEAWSQTVGPLTVAMNTHENWFVPESVKLTVPRRPTGVRLIQEGAVVLAWDRHEGDRGYRVWRLRDGIETCLTEEPMPEARLEIGDVEAGDRYAVSAITSATDAIEGTLHLHQFVVLSNRESRKSSWISLSGETQEITRFAESLPGSTPEIEAAESRCAACTAAEDLASPVVASGDPFRDAKYEVMAAMAGWKRAIEAEDVEAFLAWYAPEYREPDGRTTESVNAVLRALLWPYLKGQHGELAKAWSCVPAWSYPCLRLLVRDWPSVAPDRVEVDVAYELWMGAGPEFEPSDMFKHPWGRPNRMRMTWRRAADGWRLAATDPAFLRIEDTVPYRLTYQGW